MALEDFLLVFIVTTDMTENVVRVVFGHHGGVCLFQLFREGEKRGTGVDSSIFTHFFVHPKLTERDFFSSVVIHDERIMVVFRFVALFGNVE